MPDLARSTERFVRLVEHASDEEVEQLLNIARLELLAMDTAAGRAVPPDHNTVDLPGSRP